MNHLTDLLSLKFINFKISLLSGLKLINGSSISLLSVLMLEKAARDGFALTLVIVTGWLACILLWNNCRFTALFVMTLILCYSMGDVLSITKKYGYPFLLGVTSPTFSM